MQFLFQLRCNKLNYVRFTRTLPYKCNLIENGIAFPVVNEVTRNIHSKNSMIVKKHLNLSASSIRCLQTFDNDNVKGHGFISKLSSSLGKQTTQYALWFIGCMVLVFATASVSQENRYRSSAKKSGQTSVMDADQLEVKS